MAKEPPGSTIGGSADSMGVAIEDLQHWGILRTWAVGEDCTLSDES